MKTRPWKFNSNAPLLSLRSNLFLSTGELTHPALSTNCKSKPLCDWSKENDIFDSCQVLSQHESEILNGRDQRPSFSPDSVLRSALRVANFYRGQPKAGTGLKMLFVPFVFSMSRFQGPAFRCDKIVVIVTLLEAIEGIPDKDYNFLGNENFHNLYERLLHERKLKSGYLEGRIYERSLHLRVNLLTRIKANIFQNYLYTMYINLL